MNGSELSLRWNNHGIAFNKLLNTIYLQDEYSDGTIFCQGNVYPVHRFVLSTCSEYFEDVFRQCANLNNKHPIIIVKDLSPQQMEALLNYMYKGEVHVPQEMLPEFIKIAEAFKIRGLAIPDDDSTPKSKKRINNCNSNSISKKIRICDGQSSVINDDNNSTKYSDKNYACDEPIKSLEESEHIKIKDEPSDSILGNGDDKQNFSLKHEIDTISNESFLDQYNTSGINFEEGLESTSWDNAEEDPTQRLIDQSTSMHSKRRSDQNNEINYQEMEVYKTQKNKDKLCYNGFMYHQGTRNKTTYCWRCVEKTCRGSASTAIDYTVNRQVREMQSHNHSPVHKRISVPYIDDITEFNLKEK